MNNDDNFSRGKKFSYLSKEELLMYYFDFALKEIEMFLYSIQYKHGEAHDYLYTYHRAFEIAYKKYDVERSDYKQFLAAVLRRELIHDIENECKDNRALFSALSLDSRVICDEPITWMDCIPDPGSIDPRMAFEWVDRSKLRLSDSAKNQTVFHTNPRRRPFYEMVIKYRAAGLTLREIAERTNTSIGQVRYILDSIRKKSTYTKYKLK